jgi:SAM-dependent methyltransferase
VAVLEHLDDDTAAGAELARVVRPGGLVWITVPNAYRYIPPPLWPVYLVHDRRLGHKRHYDERRLVGLLAGAGLEHVRTEYSAHPVKVLQLALELLVPAARRPRSPIWWRFEARDRRRPGRAFGSLQLNAIFRRTVTRTIGGRDRARDHLLGEPRCAPLDSRALPLAVSLVVRARTRAVRRGPIEPSVTVIVAAHNEEPVIARRLENLLAARLSRREAAARRHLRRLDRPDRGDRRRLPRRAGDPQPARRQGRRRRTTPSARPRASSSLSPMRTRRGRRMRCAPSSPTSPTPMSPTPAASSVLEAADGSNREGLYWRYELAQRLAESRLGSITGGNGSIYAVRRSDYVEVDPKWGHDLAFPYRMVQAGRRAVYEPAARAFERPTPSNETEYRRKVRMFEHCWEITLRGSMLKRLPSGYLVQVLSHRLLRYGSGILHLLLLATSLALVGEGLVYQVVLAGQILLLAAAAARVGIARYYVLITWATVVALWNYLRRGVPATWEAAEGTR